MKKIFLVCGLVFMLCMTSCKNDTYNTVNSTVPTLNVITNLNDGSTVVSPGKYSYNLTYNSDSQYGAIATSDLIINNTSVSFSTESQDYLTDWTYRDAYFKDVKSSNANLMDASFLLTPYNFVPYIDPNTGNYGYTVSYSDVLIAQYKYTDNYKVATFQPKTLFIGTTKTTYPTMGGAMAAYETETIFYQLNLNSNENGYSAEMYLYNAKFSDSNREPLKKQIKLENLNVNFANGVIYVKGENIVPLIYEAGDYTPNANYTFTNIEFKTTNNNLTQCEIDYVVHAIQEIEISEGQTMRVESDYNGNFTGAYVGSSLLNK